MKLSCFIVLVGITHSTVHSVTIHYKTSVPQDVNASLISQRHTARSPIECILLCASDPSCTQSGMFANGSKYEPSMCIFIEGNLITTTETAVSNEDIMRTGIIVQKSTSRNEKISVAVVTHERQYTPISQFFHLRFDAKRTTCLSMMPSAADNLPPTLVFHDSCTQKFYWTSDGCLRLSSGQCVVKNQGTDTPVIAPCESRCGVRRLAHRDLQQHVIYLQDDTSGKNYCLHSLHAKMAPHNLHPTVFHHRCFGKQLKFFVDYIH